MTVKHIRIHRRRTQHERSRPEDLPAGLRDPEVVRAKTLGRAQLTGSSPKPAAIPDSSS